MLAKIMNILAIALGTLIGLKLAIEYQSPLMFVWGFVATYGSMIVVIYVMGIIIGNFIGNFDKE